MTRPIYEPTPPRMDAYLDFQQQQLFRRPAPVAGACTIEYFRAAKALTSVTVAGASQVIVDWDTWEYCSEVFLPLNTSLQPAEPGQLVRRVELDDQTYPGRYTFMWGAHNASSIGGTVEMSIHDGDDIWGRPESTLHGRCDGGLAPGFMQMTMSRIYPLFDPYGASLGFTPQISFQLAQNGGVSEDFSELVLEIHYEACVTICPPGSS